MLDEVAVLAHGMIGSARRKWPRLPEITFHFTDSTDVNAIAFRDGGYYFIGVTVGALGALRAIINRSLSDRDIFTNIGNPSEEVSVLRPLVGSTYKAVDMATRNPRNRVRNIYAGTLFTQAILFLIGHELAHIVLGHVDFEGQQGGSAFVREAMPAGRSRFEGSALDDQCEIDADRISVVSRIYSARMQWESAASKGLRLEEVRHTPFELFFDFGVAINIFFRMFGDPIYSDSEQRQAVHPANPLRRLIALASVADAAGRSWPNDANYVDIATDAVGQAILAVEDAFEKISGLDPSRRSSTGLAKATSPQEVIAMQQLMNRSETVMRDRLRPFSFEDA